MPPWETERDRVRKAFSNANLPDDTRLLKTKESWEKYNSVTNRANKARAGSVREFEKTYEFRVGLQVKQLINQAGAKAKDFKFNAVPSDNFNPTALRARAENVVRMRHEQRLIRIEMSEIRMKQKIARDAEKDSLREASKRLRKDWDKATRSR